MATETQTTEQPSKPMFTFGLPIDNTLAWYGARTIFRQNYIDVVHDRQSSTEKTEEDSKALFDWLNKIGMPTLRLALKKNVYLPENAHDIVFMEDGDFVLIASTNSSYGYLYIGAAKKGEGFDPLKNIPSFELCTHSEYHRIEPMTEKQIKAANRKAEREERTRQARARNFRGW